jgi:sec-independent protein translocase protein TatB
MFNVGGGELLVILVIALIVLGPTRLPDAARTIGKTMGEIRRLSSGFQDEMRSALDSADDPSQVASRRNLLGTGDEAPPAAEARPPRTKPLVAAPDPAAGTSPAPAKKAEPKNGAAVKKASTPKAPARRTKPS